MKIKLSVLAVSAALMTAPAFAADYVIDYDASKVSFSGIHAGSAFSGQFGEWSGTLTFYPDNLAQSYIRAEFDLSTASTGNKMYDGTLPKKDWFNVDETPKGAFESTQFTQNDDGTYTVDGELTLRDITRPLSFTADINTDVSPATATAALSVDRLAYNIGKNSDPKAEWVSQNIEITINMTATPKAE